MLFYLKEISFIRLIIPFVAGIIGYVFMPYHPSLKFMLATMLSLVTILLLVHYGTVLLRKTNSFGWYGCAVYLTFLFSGYLLCHYYTQINDAKHFSYHFEKNAITLLYITEPLVEKEKSLKTVAEAVFISRDDSLLKVKGRILVYFKKDSLSKQLKYGDRIWVKTNFNPLPEPKNPGEFNYKRFMSFRQVHHQVYLSSNDWLAQGSNEGNSVYAALLDLRKHLSQILEKHVHDKNALAVASSLILGMREKLDDDLIKAYSSSGAMHVLAVSGLHVGIIYIIFGYVFFFLDKNSRTKVLKTIIMVGIIWIYACITGLSPSVMRAAVMFTLISLATNLKRITSIYNILAISAFILLLFNPYLIMEVGFQLSYAAVAGIVMLQPKIYGLLYVKNKFLNSIWAITSVSLAAQVATFPIGLLYFHQFPVYFLFSNLIVIPAASIILYTGLALFASVHLQFPVLKYFLGWLLNSILVILNSVIAFIDALPYSLIQGMDFSIFETWLIYLLIAGMIVYVYLKINASMLIILSAFAMLLFTGFNENISQNRQKKIIVYSVPNSTAIDFIYGRKHVFYSDEKLLNDRSKMLFHIKHNWWESGLRKNITVSVPGFETPFVSSFENYFQFLDKRIARVNDEIRIDEERKKMKVEMVLVSENASVKIKDLVKIYDTKKFIFDSSNQTSSVRKWMNECVRLELDCYDVNSNGAYIEIFNK